MLKFWWYHAGSSNQTVPFNTPPPNLDKIQTESDFFLDGFPLLLIAIRSLTISLQFTRKQGFHKGTDTTVTDIATYGLNPSRAGFSENNRWEI